MHCDNHKHFSRRCADCMVLLGVPVHAPEKKAEKRPLTFLEEIVWDALKKSKCPPEHRYRGPSGGLPCRWCRAAHAVILALRRMMRDDMPPAAMIARMEELAGWKLEE